MRSALSSSLEESVDGLYLPTTMGFSPRILAKRQRVWVLTGRKNKFVPRFSKTLTNSCAIPDMFAGAGVIPYFHLFTLHLAVMNASRFASYSFKRHDYFCWNAS